MGMSKDARQDGEDHPGADGAPLKQASPAKRYYAKFPDSNEWIELPLSDVRHFVPNADGNEIEVPAEDYKIYATESGAAVSLVVGQQHEEAFYFLTKRLWPALIPLASESLPDFQTKIWKCWVDWLRIPVPASHDAWKEVARRAGMPLEQIPDDITDEWIKTVLCREVVTQHGQYVQDRQRLQSERAIADKMTEAATKLIAGAMPSNKSTTKRKRGGQRKYDSKLKKRVLAAWTTGKYMRYADCDSALGEAAGTTKRIVDTVRKIRPATE